MQLFSSLFANTFLNISWHIAILLVQISLFWLASSEKSQMKNEDVDGGE